MAEITRFEFEPTRSIMCRWSLLKAGLDDESVGNGPEIFGSEALRRVNTSGTVHAIVIRGEPLFE